MRNSVQVRRHVVLQTPMDNRQAKFDNGSVNTFATNGSSSPEDLHASVDFSRTAHCESMLPAEVLGQQTCTTL